jgi:NAD(P)-dependent dehydrogenase (short-subunit alcohol dehydrogenase family)
VGEIVNSGRLWVTGAGKGIGRAIAWEYARRGWTVAVSARTQSDLDTLVRETGDAKLPGRIVPFVADVTDHELMKQTFTAVERDIGPLDQVIFNAGTHIPNSIGDFGVAPFRTLMEVNFMGVVNGLSAVVPAFVARRAGQIGVMSSVAGYGGLPLASAYGASKAALINMCEALKPELDREGVALTVICPGFVRTPLTEKNTFAMPFRIGADEAARHIYDGMERRKFEIAFPWIFVTILKVLGMVPYALYFAVTRRIIAMKSKKS